MDAKGRKRKEFGIYKLMALSFFVIGFILSPPWNQVVWFSGGLLVGTGLFRHLLNKEESEK